MSAAAGRVQRLWRYPLKPMAGEACAQLELNSDHVAGERGCAVRTPAARRLSLPGIRGARDAWNIAVVHGSRMDG